MNHYTITLCSVLACSLPLHASIITIDNLDLPSPDESGAQSNYGYQTFTANVAGIGTSDTVASNSPLPSTVFLTSASFKKTPDGGASGAANLYIDLYLLGDTATYIGSSSNFVEINAAAASEVLIWNFSHLAIDSTLEYALVFSTDDIEGNFTTARLTAANNGSGFTNTYDGGFADGAAGGGNTLPFDSRFQVTVDTVPEPSSTALLGLGSLTLLLRRRR